MIDKDNKKYCSIVISIENYQYEIVSTLIVFEQLKNTKIITIQIIGRTLKIFDINKSLLFILNIDVIIKLDDDDNIPDNIPDSLEDFLKEGIKNSNAKFDNVQLPAFNAKDTIVNANAKKKANANAKLDK